VLSWHVLQLTQEHDSSATGTHCSVSSVSQIHKCIGVGVGQVTVWLGYRLDDSGIRDNFLTVAREFSSLQSV
jgi:hypothetical protein